MLLQIIFHAQLAAEEGSFTIEDVAKSIVNKLIRRHPHVFGETTVENSDEVLKNWEEIKKGEGKLSALGGVPATLPALLKARRVQEKARRVGFDWNNIGDALKKVVEEINELKREVEKDRNAKVEEELGDLLFSIVNSTSCISR